jgi:hypothetical protein
MSVGLLSASPALTAADVSEILAWIPTRPGYSDWIKAIAAVASVLDPREAEVVLGAWSPEEVPGEYARKLRSPCERVGIGSLIATAKMHGFDASAFARRRAAGCVARPVAPKPTPRFSEPTTSSPPKKLPKYTARLGTAAELDVLTKLRGLGSSKGLDAMQAAGCLAFADDLNDVDPVGNWWPVKSWLALDPTRRNVSARRLDGLPWICCGGAKSRCVSGPGSKSWPVGLTRAQPGHRLDVVEGEGDFVALWHLHALGVVRDATPVGLLGSCANLDAIAPEISPYVAGRTVQIFAHVDANGAGQAAAKKWAESFYRLGAASVCTRNLTAWLSATGNDLNDAVAADVARRRALTPSGYCPDCFSRNVVARLNGPTCSCVPYVWPVFTPEQITVATTRL